jgi:Mrp family chromosome partitioning ATPase
LSGYPKHFWSAVDRVAATVLSTASSESQTVMFVGAEPGAGTSTLALATAYALVRDPGVDALLVDARARQDGNRLFPERPLGLIQFALGQAASTQAIASTGQRGLSYLPRGAGSYNGPRLFEFLVPRLKSLRSQFDHIILDSAPITSAPESALLASLCDGVVVVLAAERTPKVEALRAKEILDKHQAHILGTVINRARSTLILRRR